jgi:hypothetical protein
MPRKRYKPDVLVSQGVTMADAIRQIGVSEASAFGLLGRHFQPFAITRRSRGGDRPPSC